MKGVDLQNTIILQLVKVGLLTNVHKGGPRTLTKSADCAEESLQEHDVRGYHGAFWYLRKNIAKERYCTANREREHRYQRVLMSFFFWEKDMIKARMYAGTIYIGAGLVAMTMLDTRTVGPKKHPTRDCQ